MSDSHIVEDKDPNKRAAENAPESLKRHTLKSFAPDFKNSRLCKFSLLFVEIEHTRVIRTVGDGKEAPNSTRNIDDSAHDEEPSPAWYSVDAVKSSVHRCLKVS